MIRALDFWIEHWVYQNQCEAAFTDTVNPHMNAYGGEDRIWLGPEGGMFSLFFCAGIQNGIQKLENS